MNRLLAIAACLVLILGCSRAGKSPVAIEIDGITITVDEFEQAYSSSYYAKEGSPSSRKAFLDNLILMKLLLREAERLSLHKDSAFLKNVEFFWQQSLLKSMLEKKSRELSLDIKISDREVSDYYDNRKDTDFKDRSLQEVYSQVKWLLLIDKQNRVVEEWMKGLRERSNISIDKGLLNIEER